MLTREKVGNLDSIIGGDEVPGSDNNFFVKYEIPILVSSHHVLLLPTTHNLVILHLQLKHDAALLAVLLLVLTVAFSLKPERSVVRRSLLRAALARTVPAVSGVAHTALRVHKPNRNHAQSVGNVFVLEYRSVVLKFNHIYRQSWDLPNHYSTEGISHGYIGVGKSEGKSVWQN